MEEIRILVADDELPARGELKYELSAIPGVKIVGECGNGREVLAFLKAHPHVDMLFLDIEMPIMNGLECAKEIQKLGLPVKIVFATGYSQFALQAFELEAFDYILKPYNEARMRRAVERLQASLDIRQTASVPGEVTYDDQKISIQTKDKTLRINPAKEIVLVSTEKTDRTLFYTVSGIVESRMLLRDVEKLLTPLGFFRTHKGYIVNLAMIHEIQPQDNGTLLLTMTRYDKQKIPVSRHYIKPFKEVLHI